jgi:hypothetical protein
MKVPHSPRIDLIGDIHGVYDKLARLLYDLVDHPYGERIRHPEGRKIIFLGVYIDRVPKVLQGLLLIGAIGEADNALAIKRFYMVARTLLATTPPSRPSLFIEYMVTGKRTLRSINVQVDLTGMIEREKRRKIRRKARRQRLKGEGRDS